MSIKILIADDHQLTREGIRTMLEREPDMQVLGEAEDGRAAGENGPGFRPRHHIDGCVYARYERHCGHEHHPFRVSQD